METFKAKVIFRSVIAGALLCGSSSLAQSNDQLDVANACQESVNLGDSDKFETLATEIRSWRFLFNQSAIDAATTCLTEGYGEEWDYSSILGRFVSVAEVDALQAKKTATKEAEIRAKQKHMVAQVRAKVAQARAKVAQARAMQEAKAKQARAKVAQARAMQEAKAKQALAEQQFRENAAAVSVLAYTVCKEILLKDRERALTNQVCLDHFVKFGLPAP